MDFKFGRYIHMFQQTRSSRPAGCYGWSLRVMMMMMIHRVHPNKRPLKIWRKGSVELDRMCHTIQFQASGTSQTFTGYLSGKQSVSRLHYWHSNQQESRAIAKMTAWCALYNYMDALKVFGSPWLCPLLLFSKLLMCFCCHKLCMLELAGHLSAVLVIILIVTVLFI